MNHGYVDVLVIVSTPAELDGVLALESGRAGGWTKLQDHNGATYHVREFENIRGKPFSIAGTWLGPSDARALSRAEELVKELDPTWLVATGVCDGFSEDDSLGDILFVEQVIDCRSHIFAGDHIYDPPYKLTKYKLPSSIVINAPHIFKEFLWSDKVMARWPRSFRSQVRWVLDTLYDANDTRADLRKHPDRREKCPNWGEVIKHLRNVKWIDTDDNTLGLTAAARTYVKEERLLHPDGVSEDRGPRVIRGSLGNVPEKVFHEHTLRKLRGTPFHLKAMDRVSADLVQMAKKLDRKWMVIKSIVDFAERPSVPDYVPLGSHASAECALHVLQHIFAPEERHTPSIPTSRRDTFLESITIRNFKSIHYLHLDFLQQSALSGHWTCIAGLNGAGKSAILQAIALVLLGEKLALDVGSGSLARARRRTSDETLVAEIDATVRSGQENTIDLMLRIGENGVNDPPPQSDERAYQAMRDFWNTRRKHHLLLAYGAGRNLSEYRDSRYKNRIDDEAVRQMTLFDPLCQVASVDVLLEQGPRVLPILRMLKKLLDLVLVDVDLTVQESETGLAFRCGDAEVPASELPDGFRATIAWLADICATWHEKAPEDAKDGDPLSIRGIVLIDEIDLHLHASLQRVLVPNLRKALPHVQWIVTTHSPLVVASFDRREIVLLEPGPQGPKQKQLDRQILGFSSDEVYEYLMAIEPYSDALEQLHEKMDGAEMVQILAQSPNVNEAQAQEERAHLDALAALHPEPSLPPASNEDPT